MNRRVTPPPDREPKRPILKAPAGACDSHFHIFGPQSRFLFTEPRPLDAEDCPLEDLLLDWAPDPADRQRILVDHPAELFSFPPD